MPNQIFAKVIVILVCFLLVGLIACAETNSGLQLERIRQVMVEEQIIARGIKNQAVLEAIQNVPRHKFVPVELERFAYLDQPLPIGYGQTISQPYIVALMTELAQIKPTHRVLEIGTGSGYQAAILAEIAREVYTIEILKPLAVSSRSRLSELGYKNIQVRWGDGYLGWQEFAPYDAIIVTAAPDEVPVVLIEQLKLGGRLVIPVGRLFQELKLITKGETDLKQENVIPVRFVPMIRSKPQIGTD